MTTLMARADKRSDADLVAASRRGDREAFGQIARRYQAMISGLVYCSCGDLHGSEDLAQETFVSAWKSLSGLREPQRLAAWLCQIARHRAQDRARSAARESVRLAQMAAATPPPEKVDGAPDQQMLLAEDRDLLWRTVADIPSPFRETLVLYYRQGQSTTDVARALEVSEETVRQRLTRGRQMLRQQVAAMVERNLARSAPGSAFAVGVLAALPSTPQALASAGAATAAKAGGLTKAAGLLGTILAVAAAGAGAIATDWGRVRNARSARERKFLIKANWGFWIGVLIWNVVWTQVIMVTHYKDGVVELGFSGCAAWWLGLIGPLVAFRIWMARRQKAIQIEEGTRSEEKDPRLLDPTQPGFKAIVYGSLAAIIWGGGVWLAIVGHHTGDWVLLGLWPALSLGAWLFSARVIVRHSEKARRVFPTVFWGLTLAVLLVVNLRWNVWTHGLAGQSSSLYARLSVNFLLIAFYASIGLTGWIKRRLVATPHIKLAASVVVICYLAVLLIGLFLEHITGW